jgi:membrane protease YdiL (CAAX protease family)
MEEARESSSPGLPESRLIIQPESEFTIRAVFMGPNGLRAGWRLLIFLAIFIPMTYGAGLLIDPIMHKLNAAADTALGTLVVMGVFVVPLLLSSAIMARIEGRSFEDYGLPWRRAFCVQFWQGAAISFVSITALLFTLRLAGAFSFGSLALHGADIWKYGIFWSLPFFLAAVLEDFLYRGYLLFTLTTGIGFWPAAVVSSLLMGGAHYFNPGGHGLGPFITFIFCLVTCLIVRRTGDLWMAMGLHATWDWSAVFFYGVPSGGQMGQRHLLNASFHGPAWLTGGTFGPEAGWPNAALIVIWGIIFSVWLRGVKYPRSVRS